MLQDESALSDALGVPIMMAVRKTGDATRDSAGDASVRLDLWLWAARFFRTRTLARQAVESGKVEVGGQRAKPARSVRIGDAMAIVRGEERFEIAVLGMSETRGPAPVVRSLYRESEASIAARELRNAELRAARAGYQAPQGKPDKRARRLIRALGDIDAS